MGFGKRPVLFLEFGEQPHVLDRNHGLVGEGLEEGYLPRGEESRLDAAEADRADRDALPQHGYDEMPTSVVLPSEHDALRELVRLALQVSDVDRAPI